MPDPEEKKNPEYQLRTFVSVQIINGVQSDAGV